MALKYVYDKTLDVKGWFDPVAVDEGWFDDEFAEQGGAAPTFNAAYCGATHVASAMLVGG